LCLGLIKMTTTGVSTKLILFVGLITLVQLPKDAICFVIYCGVEEHRVSKSGLWSSIFVPGIWTSLTSTPQYLGQLMGFSA
jgi:hypothetical protein